MSRGVGCTLLAASWRSRTTFRRVSRVKHSCARLARRLSLWSSVAFTSVFHSHPPCLSSMATLTRASLPRSRTPLAATLLLRWHRQVARYSPSSSRYRCSRQRSVRASLRARAFSELVFGFPSAQRRSFQVERLRNRLLPQCSRPLSRKRPNQALQPTPARLVSLFSRDFQH